MPTDPGFGLYVHWPFCLSKCPYCDFNSHVAPAPDQDRWRRALLAELDHMAALAPGRRLTSIFFGGGTPSLMAPDSVAALIGRAADLWTMADQVEITLEANPSTVEAGRFRDFRAAGINRLSLGIQALDDQSLRFLGRRHDLAEALAALDLAGTLFDRFSFDLIYARPGQTEAAWQAELTRALALAGDHLSLYQLTIEDGTAFAPAHARGDFILPDEDVAARLFTLTREMTAAHGLPAYEVSNHARPGRECRHNLTYWLGGDYAGIGPGAHGRLNGHAVRQIRSPTPWLSAVETQGHGTEEMEALDPDSRAEELAMMGLRLESGVDADSFRALCGRELWDILDPRAVARMEDGGFLQRDGGSIRATPAGMLVLNALIGQILA